MTELTWDGKYKDGKKQGPVRIALPFQTIETVNESAQDRRRNLELFASVPDANWRPTEAELRRGEEYSYEPVSALLTRIQACGYAA
jgi:hypothetical protein